MMLTIACAAIVMTASAEPSRLEAELELVREMLDIPGHAYVLSHDGRPVHSNARGEARDGAEFTLETPLRFASVTKAVTGIALVQLEEAGALSLDDPMAAWDRNWGGPEHVTVGHVAAHLSEGAPGSAYVYSSGRYARLQAVVEGAAGRTFADYICTEIMRPSGADCRESPALGAHAGLVSTVTDMAAVFDALLAGRLVSPAGLGRLFSPAPLESGDPGPVGVGWFITHVEGERVAWSFGQDDPDHSGVRAILWPDRGVSFVYLANSNAVSDAYRLLGGDPVADPIFHAAVRAVQGPSAVSGEADAAGRWLGSIYNRDLQGAAAGFLALQGELDMASSPALTYGASIMCLVDPDYASDVLPIMEEAVRRYPADPWRLLFAAEAHETCGDRNTAASHFRTLRDLPNQEQDLIGRLRRAWAYAGLARLSQCHAPDQARAFARAGLETGVPGETRDSLLALSEMTDEAARQGC
jgi:CubicO group peptidase (beta-lactamase class C family)